MSLASLPPRATCTRECPFLLSHIENLRSVTGVAPEATLYVYKVFGRYVRTLRNIIRISGSDHLRHRTARRLIS